MSPLLAASAVSLAVMVAAGRSLSRRRGGQGAGFAPGEPPVPNPAVQSNGGSAGEPVVAPRQAFDAVAAAAEVERAAHVAEVDRTARAAEPETAAPAEEAAGQDIAPPRPARLAPVPLGTPARTAQGLAKASAALAAGPDGDLEEAVHSARKRIKRARAAVRLTRGQLGEKAYRRENAELAGIGRSLGEARDAKVLVDTLDTVLGDVPAGERRRLAGFRMMLVAEHEVHAVRLRYGNGVVTAVARLRAAEDRVAHWKLADDTREGLVTGVESMYRRGRRATKTVRREPTADNLHALRKRAKDLWYATDLLDPDKDSELYALSRSARALSQLIGEDHDLAVLSAKARGLRMTFPAKRDRRLLGARIVARREELQRDALVAANELYGPKTRDWVGTA